MEYKMDLFNEHLIKVRKSFGQSLSQALIIVTAVFSSVLFTVPYFGTIIPPLFWFGAYYVMRYFSVEYEYSFTNGGLDIDKIYAQKKRVHVLSVNVKQFEILAPVTTETFAARMQDKNIKNRVDASSHANTAGTYFSVFNLEDKGRTILFFEPPEKMINAIKSYIPRRVVDE
ncbi:MAG: hypothetical protein Q8865_01975 [Bacillota bacterium]|nr:hypothetical protein [Bacillota bacterium]